ncbi:hypothetical protein NHF48_015485 [Sphingomonas sp. H160509]|uniref:hypothetical protein n=1 Tax=Sphingomonas sp. H160509 TaxID=2955313 RepID=UPI002097C9A6|nr:hypothetical protein [Sphingomonas sp. H160509]MDD1452025.1 hypothetical protein [Sphingomonas sp. H160509]
MQLQRAPARPPAVPELPRDRAETDADHLPPEQRVIDTDREDERLHHRVHHREQSDAERGDRESQSGRNDAVRHRTRPHRERSMFGSSSCGPLNPHPIVTPSPVLELPLRTSTV